MKKGGKTRIVDIISGSRPNHHIVSWPIYQSIIVIHSHNIRQ